MVAEAAVIGRIHPKWGERPLLIVVKNGEGDVTPDELKTFLDGKIAKWWIPDERSVHRGNATHCNRQNSEDEAPEMFDDYQFPA